MELIFCYNARKGVINGIIDFLHKSISPATYSCNLCSITHTYKKNERWKKFINNYKLKISFIYIDDLERNNLSEFKHEMPCCFIKKDKVYKILIDKKTINKLKNENELIRLIRSKKI